MSSAAPRLFQFTLDERDWHRYTIEGRHRYFLPLLVCDECGSTWGTTSEAYPTMDAEELLPLLESWQGRAVSNEKFDAIRAEIARFAPAGALLNPAAAIGPFTGEIRGKKALDVVWHESWTPFFKAEAAEKLREIGVRLPPLARGSFKFRVPSAEAELLEPEALPLVDFARDGFKYPDRPSCSRCGRQAGGFTRFLLAPEAAAPADVDLFRARNCPTVLICTERFRDAAARLELSGCIFRELLRATGSDCETPSD